MNYKHIRISVLMLCAALSGFAQVNLNSVPSRIVGHANSEGLTVSSFNPNLVEGRELWAPAGIAIDNTMTPPVVYVADTFNNRVLAWKGAGSFTSGAPADLVIGQPDFFSTNPGGPGTVYSAGLNTPTGIAVQNGDLYVVDGGNNRVLRFPQPFSNTQQIPNLIIGQSTLSTRVTNFPNGNPTAQNLSLVSSANQVFASALAFDGSGNLWVTDPGNRRAMRFAASDISPNPANFPSATLVLGQPSLTDLYPTPLPSTVAGAYSVSQFYVPEGIAVDSSGRVYITDSDPNSAGPGQRVLVFDLSSSKVKLIGLPPQGTTVSQDTLNKTVMRAPAGVFFLPSGGGVGVIDKGDSRVMVYPAYENWTDALVAPPATQVLGHNGDFSNPYPNNAPSGATYVPAPTTATMNQPSAGVFLSNELYVADTGNNRVTVFPLQNGTFGPATRVLGQARLDTNSINYIDGREFEFGPDAGIAVDSTGSTPHLYVADQGNHRVLGFRDLRSVKANSKADIVIGQPDFQTARCNYPTSDPNQPTQTSLCGPVGLLVDSAGNLYVADSLNGRVLRFPAPFTFADAHPGQMQPADLVLGQRDFTSKFTDPSQFNMKNPYGLAFSGNSGLLVSDVAYNRVLFFSTISGPLTSGKAADKVYGQNLFNSITSGSDGLSLNAPRHIAADSDGRLYVADTGNNRVQVFPDPNNPNTPARGAQSILSITDSLAAPYGVFVSPITGEIWITDTNNAKVKHYPRFDQVQLNPSATASIPAAAPTVAVAQDQYGDLLVADRSYRVAIYFPALEALNGANFLPNRSLAPGMVASICSPGSHCVNGASVFPTDTIAASLPLPTKLGDLQVLFNGQPTPIYYVSATQINFVVPMGKNAGDVPTSGLADLQVVKISTGQVLAAGLVQMNVSAPGIFQFDFYPAVNRRAAVLNADGTANTPTNQAARGSIISIYLTGQGFVPGAPPDGQGATTQISTPVTPTVIIGACRVDDTACTNEPAGHVKYSGLNGYPGGWQINVQIPQNTAPGTQVLLGVTMNDVPNSDGSFRATIAVK